VCVPKVVVRGACVSLDVRNKSGGRSSIYNKRLQGNIGGVVNVYCVAYRCVATVIQTPKRGFEWSTELTRVLGGHEWVDANLDSVVTRSWFPDAIEK
jgi:hypothetical protein